MIEAMPFSYLSSFLQQIICFGFFLFFTDLVSATTNPLEMLIPSLRQAGYGKFAAAIAGAQRDAPFSSATFLAPPDGVLAGVSISPEFVRCHAISGGAFTYRRLVSLYSGMKIGTLQGNLTIAITQSLRDQRVLEVGSVPVENPNLYFDGRFSVHGLARPLNCSTAPPEGNCRAAAAPERSCEAAASPPSSALGGKRRRQGRSGKLRRGTRAEAPERRISHDRTSL